MRKYFFYSRKLDELTRKCDDNIQNYAIIDGKEVPYNISHSSMEHGCLWDDMVFLGKGEWSRAHAYKRQTT